MSYDQYDGGPPRQRHSPTSSAAATAIKPKVGWLQGRVLAYIAANGPATDEEMQRGIPMSGNTQRPRRRELQLMGVVEDSLLRRKTRAGKRAVVWQRNIAWYWL